ncbi:hypothetical protein NE693_17280, partial [Faecalibacterium prausnitzii]|nr:hypothetical protein [Faecalibacterium prausnitzii]
GNSAGTFSMTTRTSRVTDNTHLQRLCRDAFYNTFMLYSAAFTHIPFLKTNAKVILKDEK